MQARILLFIGAVILGLVIVGAIKDREIRYVAVGDSYTIGTSVDPTNSWPQLLVRDLVDRGIKIKLAANLAKDSKATVEVITEQLPTFNRFSPTFATILVGANDFNRGYPAQEFQNNLEVILDHVVAKLPKNRLVVLTIPDFSVTPVGKSFGDPTGNSRGILQFNEIIKTEAARRNLPVVDVFPLSQQMSSDSSLVSSDGLHPSVKEYTLWEKQIFPVVYNMLRTQ